MFFLPVNNYKTTKDNNTFGPLQEAEKLQRLYLSCHRYAETFSKFPAHLRRCLASSSCFCSIRCVHYEFENQGPSSPLIQHKIIKMELQAALYVALLARFNKQQQRFSLTHLYFWTESSTALQWVRGSDKRRQTVANRVAEILEFTQLTQ